MPIGNNAAALAGQLEKLHSPDLEEMFQLDAVLWKQFKARPKDTVSTRPERIVYKVYPGGKSRVVNLDGGDLGRGGGPQYAFGNIAPVSFDWIMEWTKLAEIGTDSAQKSIVDYGAEVVADHAKIGGFNLDSLSSYGDGSNTLGVLQANSAGTVYDNVNFVLYVDNATRFYAGQDIDLYSALSTTILATVTVVSPDNNNKALYLQSNNGANPLQGITPGAGYVLLENNSTGVANSGLNGILAYQLNATTGTYTGVSRAAYPGAFTTPTVNAGGATLSPQIARLLLTQLKLARGINTRPGTNVKLHMGLDQQTAWENVGLNITQLIQSGDRATARDPLAAEAVVTIGGIPILTNLKAIQGRIDLLDFDTWYRTEVQPLDFYEVGGQRVFWPMGASGGVSASMISYMYWMGNLVCDNPRSNAYISGLAIPQGL